MDYKTRIYLEIFIIIFIITYLLYYYDIINFGLTENFGDDINTYNTLLDNNEKVLENVNYNLRKNLEDNIAKRTELNFKIRQLNNKLADDIKFDTSDLIANLQANLVRNK
jgi:hypothetical protein